MFTPLLTQPGKKAIQGHQDAASSPGCALEAEERSNDVGMDRASLRFSIETSSDDPASPPRVRLFEIARGQML